MTERIEVLTEKLTEIGRRDEIIRAIRRSEWYTTSLPCWIAVEGLGGAISDERVSAWMDELRYLASQEGVNLYIHARRGENPSSPTNAARIRYLHALGGRVTCPEGRAVRKWLVTDPSTGRQTNLMKLFEAHEMVSRERNSKGQGNTVLVQLNYENELVRQILATEAPERKPPGPRGLRMDLPAKARRTTAA